MAAEIGDPTGDTGTGELIKAKETQRHSITRTAQDSVAGGVEVDTGTMAETSVCEGATIKTSPPPHKDGKKNRGGGKTGREGGSLA